jgi:hypothetical protein
MPIHIQKKIGRNGGKFMGFIPVWAGSDGGTKQPKISVEKYRTVYGLTEQLEKFDAKAGYLLPGISKCCMETASSFQLVKQLLQESGMAR